MPEGDTVWQTARRLDRGLAGERLVSAELRVPGLATRDLAGAVVLGTATRGKNLLTRLDAGLTLHSHLVMEGRWDVYPAGTRWRRPAFQARAVLRAAGTEAVGFDVRLRLVRTDEEDALVGHLGPDLLAPDWDAERAAANLHAVPERPLIAALLDQRNLAGIGNVYANELCFLAGRHPFSAAGDADLGRIVTRAHALLVANRDRVERVTTGDDRRGRRTWVYGRRGPCLRCDTPIHREQAGEPGRERPTYWCPRCQSGP